MRIVVAFALTFLAAACSTSSAAQNCFGGCACFTTESACKSNGCPWTDAGCSNVPTYMDGGAG